MNKAIFLDRDGTINVEKHYVYKTEDFEFLPGVIDGLRQLQNLGYLLFIVTNQSGIGRGYYTEEDFIELTDWMLKLFEDERIHISKVYFCPHLPDAKIEKYRVKCECRKPKLGMYEQAVNEFDIDLTQSFAIGDKIRDCAICETTECKGFLIGNNEKMEIINNVKKNEYANIYYAISLFKCAGMIVNSYK